MSLGSLPEELVLHVASFLGRGDLNILSQSCKDFERILGHQLYLNDRKGAKRALRWGAENGSVGTIRKARQAGYDLNERSWQDYVIFCVENIIGRLMMSNIRNSEYLRFNEDREGSWFSRTPLVHAIRNGHHDAARYLIDEGARLDGNTIGGTNRGRTWLQPIHHVILAAAEARELHIETEAAPWQDLLLYILEKGVDPNTPGMVFETDEADAPSRMVTPLGMSLQAGCPWEITEILLSHSADPTQRTGFSIRPETLLLQPFEQVWRQLVSSEEVEVAKRGPQLRKSADQWSKKATEDCIKKLRLLLEILPDLNDVYVQEEPLLLLLTSHVSPARAELLKAVELRGHDLDTNDRVKEGTMEPPIVRLISAMKADAKMGHRTCDRATGMQYAASVRAMLQTLLRLGADPNAAAELPPLQQVCSYGGVGPQWDAVFEILIDHGARLDADTTDHRRWTPLHCVCSAKGPINLPRLRRLLELGSPVNALSANGDTALTLLHQSNYHDPCLLRQAGMKAIREAGTEAIRDAGGLYTLEIPKKERWWVYDSLMHFAPWAWVLSS